MCVIIAVDWSPVSPTKKGRELVTTNGSLNQSRRYYVGKWAKYLTCENCVISHSLVALQWNKINV